MSIKTWLKKHKTNVRQEEEELEKAIQLSLQYEMERKAKEEEEDLNQWLSSACHNREASAPMKQTEEQQEVRVTREEDTSFHISTPPPQEDLANEEEEEEEENDNNDDDHVDEDALVIDDVEAWLNSDVRSTPIGSSSLDPMRSSPLSPLFFETYSSSSSKDNIHGPVRPSFISDPFEESDRSRPSTKKRQRRDPYELSDDEEDPLAAFVEPMIVREKVYPARSESVKSKRVQIDKTFECPICLKYFPGKEIESHAATCNAFEEDEEDEKRVDAYLSSPTRKVNSFETCRRDGNSHPLDHNKGCLDEKKNNPVKPKTMAAAVAKAREAAKRKKDSFHGVSGTSYNYYATDDGTIEDEIGDAGLASGTGHLAWESVGQARYN
ncbi:hypothetical protein EC973_002527 [Apophysomyces ossiformis]|uniref:Uncharacterized protein n=1 Tax=Apophysomyces ossiformis TaxID=679940 RepID=A0A8H7BTV8_9FUNG|nr:hypothetical protein EC973_002527 [Apophysomyces ossiformis]